MRLGVLRASSLTILGLAQIDEGFNVFAMPFFYDSSAELHHVMVALTPALEERLRAKGFVLLGWGDAGWLQVFSKQPVHTLAELKQLELYTSAGFDPMVQWYKANGFEPRPLAFGDVPAALATGLIEAVPITPVAALFLQWFEPRHDRVGISRWSATDSEKTERSVGADRGTLRAAGARIRSACVPRWRAGPPGGGGDAARTLTVSTPSDPVEWRAVGDLRGAARQPRPRPADRAVAERDAFGARGAPCADRGAEGASPRRLLGIACLLRGRCAACGRRCARLGPLRQHGTLWVDSAALAARDGR
jgi:hypothetical protein